MSRIGKLSIAVPAGVDFKCEDNVVTVKGPKGTLTRKINGAIEVKLENGHINLTTLDNNKQTGAYHGLYRALIAGMVKGVHEGYTKALEVKGVGWKVAKQGNKIVMNIGFSHPVEYVEPEGIKLDCPSPTDITVTGIDKEKVGQVAANIRSFRVPEPYHGYGIRDKGEYVEHKEGKTSGKGKK